MRTFQASGLEEVLRAVRTVRADWEGPRTDREFEAWFRGDTDGTYGLVPGIYRKAYSHLDEETILTDFENLAPLHLDREPRDQWDWYFTAQHYGVPTRLLDWTENLMVALYFAVMSPPVRAGATPCVWIIDPAMLNCLTIGKGDDHIIAPVGTFSAHWLPTRLGGRSHFSFEGKRYSTRLPMAISPRRATPRIVAQQGMFTVHGTAKVNLVEVFASAPSKSRLIARIDIDPTRTAALREDLRTLGMTRLAVFPELGQIAQHLKEVYAPADKPHAVRNTGRRPNNRALTGGSRPVAPRPRRR